jgi:hypothetical protein
MRPESLPPRRIVAVLRRHLDELEDKASPPPGRDRMTRHAARELARRLVLTD